MTEIIKTTSIAKGVAQADDIILRSNSNTRLLFRPLICDNLQDSGANITGCFIVQKKGRNDNWEEYKDIAISDLKKGEGLKLELHSKEILTLLDSFEKLKQIYSQYGVRYGETEFHISDQNIDGILEKLSVFEDKGLILDALSRLDISQLENIESLVSINRFKRSKEEMERNMENSDEKGFWQPLFKREAWILSQIFSAPFVFVDDEFFVGGKRGNNQGGVFTDYLFQNSITKNIAFIEVKTPIAELVRKTTYRGKKDTDNNAVYAVSDELSGAINQLLNQKKTFLQKQDSLEESDKFTYNTRCILISGDTNSLTEGQLKSFELYRSSLKDVEIITFNELLKKIQNLLELFSGESGKTEEFIEDIPF
ncbi:MAG: DUF4263 domain-containing protein [Candidatus Gracilibacteria bacterium]|nr:DUF4263 domain-containing protein [Candidatus Gracilibacteria bacterium]